MKSLINVIYGLLDPISKELRYIGKTNRPKHRLSTHHCPSKLISNNHHNNWIRSLLDNNLRAEMIIIEVYGSYEELNQAEIDMISYFRFVGSDLTNSTPGGDGAPKGRVPWNLGKTNYLSNEAKNKISVGRKGKGSWCKGLNTSFKGSTWEMIDGKRIYSKAIDE